MEANVALLHLLARLQTREVSQTNVSTILSLLLRCFSQPSKNILLRSMYGLSE